MAVGTSQTAASVAPSQASTNLMTVCFRAARFRATLCRGHLLLRAWVCSRPPNTTVGLHRHHTLHVCSRRASRFLHTCRNRSRGAATTTQLMGGAGTTRLQTPLLCARHSIPPVVGSHRTMRALSPKADHQTRASWFLRTLATGCRCIGCPRRQPFKAAADDLRTPLPAPPLPLCALTELRHAHARHCVE